MTYCEFCLIVRSLCRIHKLSVTSWGRTVERNRKAGGLKNSWHLDFMAVDCEPDDRTDATALKEDAEALGLDCVLEVDHVHLEPRGSRLQSP